MRIKVSMRLLNSIYGVGNVKTRTIMCGVLSSEQMEKFTDRFSNLDKLAEAKDADIINVMGDVVNTTTLKRIKSVMEEYYTQLTYYDTLTGMPSEVLPVQRVAWGRLIDDTSTYGTSISGLQKAINKCPDKVKKFIRLRYGINKNQKNYSYAEISKKIDVPVCELDEFEVKALNTFTETVLSSRK